MFAPEPETVEVAAVVAFVITPKLRATKPPSKLSDVPLTGPDALIELTGPAYTPVIVPPFTPMKPPTQLCEPVLVTFEVKAVVEFVTMDVTSATPINPPRMLLSPPLTAPVAEVLLMVPSVLPVNPPARLTAPTVTLPVAWEFLMVALLK